MRNYSGKYKYRGKRPKSGFQRNKKPVKIKPGADAALKRIFSGIGSPEKKPFTPDPYQLEALDAIKRADCLVTAPTGAGKTWIARQAIERVLARGGRSWYASPLKALTNSKFTEFSEYFGAENMGILTGDRKECPDSPIVVGTTEILRNQLYDAMHRGEDVSTDFVVLDEAHYLGDEDRGVVWEEVMIYLPPRIPLLMLSATIGNAWQIAGWLSEIRSRECIVVEERKRPVPLHTLFFHPTGTLLPLVSKGGRKGKQVIHKKVRSHIEDKNAPQLAPPRRLPPLGDILRVLKKYRLTPAIFFLKSRADCDKALDLCSGNRIHDQERRDALEQRIDEMTGGTHAAGHRQMGRLKNLAVGAHHSGQLPAWKLVIETLMTEGLLDAVFATSTVAAGVNFPARTILFLNSDRYNGREFLPLDATQFHQMTGRAGRRGMDRIGFAVAIPGKFMDVRLVAKLITSPPSYVLSRIKINFSMALNLLLSHTPPEIEELLKKSFATWLLLQGRKKRNVRGLIEDDHRYLWRDFKHHLRFLKDTDFVNEDGTLTDDGIWTSQLRVDQPLMIAEGFRLGVFPESDPALLAGIMAAFVNENEFDDRIDKKYLPKKLRHSFLTVRNELFAFAKFMTESGFDTRPLFLRPVAAIYHWATGMEWEKALSIAEMAEGDFAMLILRTADNLRHVRSLSNVFPQASETAGKSIDAIMREPVAMLFG